MSLYELSYLISPNLKEEEAVALQEKINSLVSKTIKLLRFDKIKKIKLAYPIQKKEEAFLASLDFQTEAGQIEELKKEIEKEKNILRFLLIKKRPRKEIKKREIIEVKKELKSPEKKVGLKEIEEKLEKILENES